MRSSAVKLVITLIAIAMLFVRLFKPAIKIDSAVLILVAMAVLPWLSSVIKAVELLGFKVEFQDPGKGKDEKPQVNVQMPAQSVAGQTQPYMGANSTSFDSYSSRLLKYTPLEMIVGFILTGSMLPLPPWTAWYVRWVHFAFFLLLTPLYLWFVTKFRSKQLVIATIGFAVWVFAIGGPFMSLSWYTQLYGGLALAVFTFIAPLIP